MRFHQFQGVGNIILPSATDRVFCHTSIDPCVRGVPAGRDHVQAEVAIGYHAHQSGRKGILDDRQNSSIGFLHQQGGRESRARGPAACRLPGHYFADFHNDLQNKVSRIVLRYFAYNSRFTGAPILTLIYASNGGPAQRPAGISGIAVAAVLRGFGDDPEAVGETPVGRIMNVDQLGGGCCAVILRISSLCIKGIPDTPLRIYCIRAAERAISSCIAANLCNDYRLGPGVH